VGNDVVRSQRLEHQEGGRRRIGRANARSVAFQAEGDHLASVGLILDVEDVDSIQQGHSSLRCRRERSTTARMPARGDTGTQGYMSSLLSWTRMGGCSHDTSEAAAAGGGSHRGSTMSCSNPSATGKRNAFSSQVTGEPLA